MQPRKAYTLAAVAVALLFPARAAASQPSLWRAQALCIHLHESVRWDKRTDWRGRPSWDHGGYQIDVRTWAAFAPRAYPRDPADATPRQQTRVAYLIWRHDGNWHEWPNSSRECGLR